MRVDHATYKKIKTYFKRQDLLSWKPFSNRSIGTSIGCFLPCDTDIVFYLLDYLIHKNIISEGNVFCDNGSGDGRAMILANAMFKMPSIGIEGEDKYYYKSRTHIRHFIAKKLIDDEEVIPILGDFRSDESYQEIKYEFKDVKVHFNYQTNARFIAEKIFLQGNLGTVFLHHNFLEKPLNFRGLDLTLVLEATKKGQIIEIEKDDKKRKKKGHTSYYMDVYTKNKY
ncbi:hypothetical protein GOV05_01400 [Candidatus Woesearchaeota archaeon]|nr:hypothetical protein [Candidatus Woesearchaeota archaeon]